ncbi:hypothetical protein [Streptomyces sp. NPDC046862]|uniref:hypothetical protein n=1 Tax=Streptomyces sp. NPDC046862 TaxID=3154603 RepID=UPI003453F57B
MPTSSSLTRRAGARPGVAALAALTVAGTAFFVAPTAVAAPGDRGDIKIRMTDTDAVPQAGRPKVCEFYLEAVNFESAQGISWAIERQPAKPGSAQLSGRVLLTDGAGRTDDNLALPEAQYKITWRVDGGTGAGKQKPFKIDCTREAPASAHAPGGAPETVPNDGPNGDRNAAPGGVPNAVTDDGAAAEPHSGPNAAPRGDANAEPRSGANAEPGTGAEPGKDAQPGKGAELNSGVNAESNAEVNAEPERNSEPNAEAADESNGERKSEANTEPNGGPPAGGGGLAQEQDFAPVAGAAAVGLAAVAGAAYFGLRRRRSDGAA